MSHYYNRRRATQLFQITKTQRQTLGSRGSVAPSSVWTQEGIEVTAQASFNLSSKLEVMKVANQGIVFNSLGLPEGYYRADLLPTDEEAFGESVSSSNGSLAGDSTSGSGVPLDGIIDEGMAEPTEVSDGLPDDELPEVPRVSAAELSDEGKFREPEHIEAQAERNAAYGEVLGFSPPAIVVSIPEYVLKAAWCQLDYTQGYPATSDGNPFWYKLDHEPEDAYTAFEVYLRQGLKGARQLFLLSDEPALKKRANLLGLNRLPQSVIVEWSNLYYWTHRAKAFDLLNAASIRKSRAALALVLENQHFRDATRMYERLLVIMKNDEFWASLTPKEVFAAFKMTTELQRMSLGLAAGGPSGKGAEEGTRRQESLESIMQSVSKEAGVADAANTTGNSKRLAELMSGDAEAMEAVQKLLVKSHG